MAGHRTTWMQGRDSIALFDQEAMAPARVAFRRSFRLRSWLFPIAWITMGTTEWVLGDHLLVVRGLAAVLTVRFAAYFLQIQFAEASADEHGVWRRYGWVTTRLGWQQHWPWPEVASVSASTQAVTFRSTRGRTAELVSPMLSTRDDERFVEFARQVDALAVLAGVPVVAPPTWRERWAAWRGRATR